MKLIRIIIALSSIYLFIGVISLLAIILLWLARFNADMPTNTVAGVVTDSIDKTESQIEFTEYVGTTALSTMLSRGKLSEQKVKRTFRATTDTLFVTYKRVTFVPTMMPIGFSSIYRIESISDAEGRKLFVYNNDFLDYVSFHLLGGVEDVSEQTVAVLARPRPTSYTVTISTKGITNNEN